MIKVLSLLALLLVSLSQRPGTNIHVIPTKVTVDPTPFRREQMISIKASFEQKQDSVCPTSSALRDKSDGFQVRIYDEKDVATEPSGEQGNETKYIAFANALVAPRVEDDGKKVGRDFESVKVPSNAPARIYVVVWRECTWKVLLDPTVDPPIYKPGAKRTQLGGGKFFKYECPGSPRRPAGLCAYRPE